MLSSTQSMVGNNGMTDSISYIDGVGRVTVVNGMTHIDLVAVIPPSAEGGQAQMHITHRLVMGLPQFVRLCAEMTGHLQKMEEKGLIKRSSN